MKKILKYVRISEHYDIKSLQNKLDEITSNNMEIIYYNEKILDKDRIYVTMLLAKRNRF